MGPPNTHTAHNDLEVNRSPGTAEARTGGAAFGYRDSPCSSPKPTVSVSMQDAMARTRKTVVDPEYKGETSEGLPPDSNQAEMTRGSPHGTPSTPSD